MLIDNVSDYFATARVSANLQIGRKPLIIWGGISMTIAHAGVAGLIAVYGHDFDVHQAAGRAAIFLGGRIRPH